MTERSSTDDLEETFSIVANDIRLDILRTLWEIYTDNPSPEPEPVPFSTLKDRVGVRDSGQFHYHLDELVPRFITRHEDGYTLTYAGGQIIGATLSGVYTETETELDTVPVDACPNQTCDGDLEIGYEEGHVFATCDTCDQRRIMSAPPILVRAHDVEENPELLGKFTMTQLQKMLRGFCYLCSGPVSGRVAQSALDTQGETPETVKFLYTCQECGAPSSTAATTAILDHPATVSLLHDAGLDYRESPSWRIIQTLNAEESIRNDDPVRVAISVSVEGTTLEFVLDESLSVVEYSEQ